MSSANIRCIGDGMTPPDAGCLASSELSGGSLGAGAHRGTRASRKEGRATGPKWPLIAHYTSAENAAEAVITVYRVPSWSHGPSHELRELISQVSQSLRPLVEELAEMASLLAPEHGRLTYGEPSRGLTPWDIYRGRC